MSGVLTVNLDSHTLDALHRVGKHLGMSGRKLAAQVLEQWAGRVRMNREDPNDEVAAERLAILHRWWELRRNGTPEDATDRILSQLRREGSDVSRTSLYEWDRRWRGGGLESLTDGRRTARPAKRPSPFMLAARRLWITESGISMREAHRRTSETAKSKGWRVHGYKAFTRFVRSGIERHKTAVQKQKTR